MVFWSSVCSAVSGACSFIGRAASVIGNTVAGIATSIAQMGVTLAARVGETIKNVGISLGIIKPDDDFSELGEKAMMSDKKPEDFDSMSDYIDHLRNDVVIDREKFKALDEKELLARSSIGAAITLQGINEKLDTIISPEFMAIVTKQNLDAKEIVATINAYKENEINTNEYSLYINDELTIEQCDKHSTALVQAYTKLEPELSIEQIEDKVMGLK